MKNKRNLLVTLADENYIDQAKQLFSSVYWNAGWKGDYMLLAHEIPEKKLKWFRNKGILIKKCKPFYNKKIGGWPVTVLSKFYLFTPEFKKWKNIIYLDADIIVRASLDKLAKVNGFGAVEDITPKFKEHLNLRKNKIVSNQLKRNYNINSKAFNSGLMAFNTQIIRRDIFVKLKKLLEEYSEINRFDDQVPLNLLFHEKWIKLYFIYNIIPHYLINFCNIKPKKIKGIVLHFITLRNKPWLLKNPFYREWKANLEKAELIDLKKIPPPIKIWTIEEIKRYESFLKNRYSSFKYFIWKISIIIDYCIGFLSLFLKKHHSKLYFKLKELKSRK